jgi:mono/diheme cytochrome c family protein
MSDAHDHGAHAPEPAELTNPFLWTAGLVAICGFLVWLFFHFLGEGRIAARGHERVHAQESRPAEPDHEKLAADKSQEVIEKGQQLYVKNCASCHGSDGTPPPGAGTGVPPRNFRTDAFKNPNGGGPYGIYSVISHGYGAMPGILSVPPEGRYAVAHYIRETWVKKDNAANYAAQDKVPLPKGGGGAAVEKQYPPNEQPVPDTLHPLMRVVSEQAAAEQQRIAGWLSAAESAADPATAGDVAILAAYVSRRQQLASALYQSARANDRERFVALVTAADCPGAANAELSLMPEPRMAALFDHVKKAAGADR